MTTWEDRSKGQEYSQHWKTREFPHRAGHPLPQFLQQHFPNDVSRAPYISKFGAVACDAMVFSLRQRGDVVLIDVNPLALGIGKTGGAFTRLIPRNTVVPTRQLQFFSTPARRLDPRQGLVCELKLAPPAPRGVSQVDVTFGIDANGIVNVSAADERTTNPIIIKNEKGHWLRKESIAQSPKPSNSPLRTTLNTDEALNPLSAFVYGLNT
ncbi:heat shock protein 70kD, peptide-binding domain-containing protein [Pluteus cervinus]|uniref:Heat shock protein 70kD, peptide-binding domain-containing protein n=1 Tax=Pluteus cervinus TaxID=181527 RepID=A0ACD3B303_9AGAR|nr:heat shock protein 70kD, peptide-binding domain-containing protein [Pluteus cervinus]